MEEFLARAWDQLIGRTSGPMRLRFLLQPAMATILAVRAERRDEARHAPPRSLVRSARHDVGQLAVFAFSLDTVYQVAVFRAFHPIQALIVTALLALAPYILIRGPIARVARRWWHP